MAKTALPDSSPAPTPATPPALPLPTQGGCWVRLPDGTLIREEQAPADAAPKEQAP